MSILVCGGAGYIGSHTVLELVKNGEDVLVVDNLEKGHKEALMGQRLIKADLRDKEAILDVFKNNDIEAVINFAAYMEAGESVKLPLKYYDNNLRGSINLLSAMKEAKVDKIVFSSTAAVYGIPDQIPIDEKDQKKPINPYGETKLAIEQMLKWNKNANDINYIALRYFNAAGADISGEIGEDHSPETHLIPLIIQNLLGQRDGFKIFGDDYETKDGTCIRDYIHVTDLAQAHYRALDYLREKNQSNVFNLGNGKGFSNKEIVDVAKEVSGKKLDYTYGERRKGDPAVLIASSKKAKKELNWKPEYSDIKDIVSTAWNWHKNHPEGFNS